MTNYTTPAETAQLTRQATPDETWIAAQLGRINPHADEMGHDGEYIRALETLAFDQRKAMQQALESLTDSVDVVRNEYETRKAMYSNLPTRQKQVNGLKDGLDAHEAAIAALRQSLADHAEDVLNMVKAAEPVAREPLSKKQLAEVMEAVDFTYNPTQFARAIEAAHGIHPTSAKGST